MSRFVKDETVAIDLGDGDVVHIRARMSYGQQRELGALAAGKDQVTASSEYLIAVLERNIVRWEGPGFQNGTGPMAITRENLDALESETAIRLVNEIAARNGVQADSFTTSAASSSLRSSTAPKPRPSTPSSPSANATDGVGTH